MYEVDGETYASEEDYLDSLKGDDNYHFSVDFEYIEQNHGDDNYDIGTATMEVDATWSDSQHGYELSFDSPDADSIDPSQGNGDLGDFFDDTVYDDVMEQLSEEGIPTEAVVPYINE